MKKLTEFIEALPTVAIWSFMILSFMVVLGENGW